MPPRTPVIVAAFLLWSLFSWGGRIRNALADDAVTGWDRTGPILLALSFAVPALVLAVGWWLHVGRTGWTGKAIAPVGPALWTGTLAFAGWTIAVWVVRGVDIALFSDHAAGFVVVHTVLALVAIALAAIVAATLIRSGGGARRSAQIPSPGAS